MDKILKFLVGVFVKIVFFVRLENEENIPDGAVILAANHTSLWDAPVLVSSVKRSMKTMAKAELFRHKILAPILRVSGAIPVKRGTSDIGAIKTALSTLKKGEIFTIFPSGKRVLGNESAEAKGGVALISAKANAPVVPVNIKGGYRAFKRVTIRFGTPILINAENPKKPTSEEIRAFADSIMEKIEELGK